MGDRVTVLRDGATIHSGLLKDLTRENSGPAHGGSTRGSGHQTRTAESGRDRPESERSLRRHAAGHQPGS